MTTRLLLHLAAFAAGALAVYTLLRITGLW
jgi:hypothetical protein